MHEFLYVLCVLYYEVAFVGKYTDYKQTPKSGQSFTRYKEINGHRYSVFYMVRQMACYSVHLKVPLGFIHL